MSNSRGVIGAGIVGLAVGVFLGNSVKKGIITRQMRTTGRTVLKRARATVGRGLMSWID
ncbi:MAG: hypothetical protein GX335_04155 [Firmicutes bacterium]|nr:hypothetical protein [Bacillota bacterium]